mgnify:FL=1
MSEYLNFKTIFESKISIHDKRKISGRFASTSGLPESLEKADNIVYMAAGRPFETLFPFKEINVEYRDTPGKLGVKEDSSKNNDSNKVFTIPMYKENEEESDIAISFQYQVAKGAPNLLLKTRKIVESLNKPGYEGWDTVLTSGSSDSMNKTFALLVDEETTVLCEEFTYPNVFHNCCYYGGKATPLKMNVTDNKEEQGINIDYLQDLLENFEEWFPERKQKKCVLYTICTGHNPTALTESFTKRKLIYDLCLKHNVFIIEDDPYGYLQLPKFDKNKPFNNPYENGSFTLKTFTNNLLVPSYLTLDTKGIVLRLETFSKVVCPGMRLGFIVANSFFTERLANISQLTNRYPSGGSMSFLNNFLNTISENYKTENKEIVNTDIKWTDGWVDWCMKIACEYTHRRNVLFKAIYETDAYKKNLFSLLEPSCGMFASIVINLKPEYYISDKNKVSSKQDKINKIKRAMDYLFCCILEAGTVVILGYKMTLSKEFSMERATFMRITFAKAGSEEQFVKGAKGLSDGIETFFDEYMTNKERWNLPPTGLEGM